MTDAGKSNKVASLPLGRLKLYDDRIDVNGKSFPLTPEVQATVDTAGNLSSTRRHTLTRFCPYRSIFAVYAEEDQAQRP